MTKTYSKFGMRGQIADELFIHMYSNPRIWIITGDLGFGLWDRIRATYPDRFINAGASEQAMMGLGVGLALEGKIPFVYSITPFLLYRPFETLRNYVNQEQIPVKLLASGRGQDYASEGFSHWANEDKRILKLLPHIKAKWPKNVKTIPRLVCKMLQDDQPWYVNLRK